MKDYSVAQIKTSIKNPRKKIKFQKLPREGSLVREIYNLFDQFKGQIIDFGVTPRNVDRALHQLINFYGMDIIRVSKGKWRYAGEYVGAKYLSYVDLHPMHIKIKHLNK